jgi:hypothetical protein
MQGHEVGWRHRCRRELGALTGALAAALALLTWGAAPASAGGPTSVLVVSPESTETASLYYSDKEYGELERLLGRPGAATDEKPPESDLTAARQINITWLIHDVSPWRLDQVYPIADAQDVWIHTGSNLPESTARTWHRADQPIQLRKLLKKLGVMGKASAQGHEGILPQEGQASTSDDGTTVSEDSADESTEPESAAQVSGSDGGTDWWWALPGAAAGAVLALVARPFVTRLPLGRPRGEPGPRQELRDV